MDKEIFVFNLKFNLNPEKVTILIIIIALTVTSAYWLNTLVIPITREEAIEISKNSESVKEGLAIARSFSIEANYYNSSGLEQLKEWHTDEIFRNVPKDTFWEERVPEGHTAWEIVWWFSGASPDGRPSAVGGYSHIVIVDAEVGAIIHELKGVLLD